jgi:hypothetical protein
LSFFKGKNPSISASSALAEVVVSQLKHFYVAYRFIIFAFALSIENLSGWAYFCCGYLAFYISYVGKRPPHFIMLKSQKDILVILSKTRPSEGNCDSYQIFSINYL